MAETTPTLTANEKPNVAAATAALKRATEFSLHAAQEDGHWIGELRLNETITAQYVMLRQSLGLDQSQDRDALRQWFLSEQTPDGSWAIAPDYPGCVSVTTEVYFALKLLGVSPDDPAMVRAREFVLGAGGVAKVRMFTRMYLAMFGLFPWKAVPELPVELILVPSWAPINIYKLASWARSTVVPLMVVFHHRPIYPLPNGTLASNPYLDELWQNPGDKMVPYTPGGIWTTDLFSLGSSVFDTILHGLGGLRSVPLLRAYSRKRCIDWILERQEEEGDWAGIFPPMHLNILALILEGFKVTDPPVHKGLAAIERFAWCDERGKRMQSCVSPVWDTMLMTIALCDSPVSHEREAIDNAVRWIQNRQHTELHGDWLVYNPNSAPGGWSFEYHNTWYPDVDNTAGAIIAFIKAGRDPWSEAIFRAVSWILGMQNRDGGWAAFDTGNDALFLNKIPFSDMDSLCDPSTADVTGRALEAFALLLQSASKGGGEGVQSGLAEKMRSASDRAIQYLLSTQEANGSWYGRWGVNYIYGTSHVLCALPAFAERDPAITDALERAARWFVSIQNPDGGWGEGCESYLPGREWGEESPSTASQTGWALMGLLSHLPPESESIQRGIAFLVDSQRDMEDQGATWVDTRFTGTGFPNYLFLGYKLYAHYFPMMALGRYLQLMEGSDSTDGMDGAC